jgi:hypothetical protein
MLMIWVNESFGLGSDMAQGLCGKVGSKSVPINPLDSYLKLLMFRSNGQKNAIGLAQIVLIGDSLPLKSLHID